MENTTKLTKAAANNRFHTGQKITAKGSREKGERLEDQGNGTSILTIDGKFIAIVQNR